MSGVRRVDAVELTVGAAREIVAALALLAEFGAHRGAALSPSLAGIARDLDAATRADAHADASTSVESVVAQLLSASATSIDTTAAAAILGITPGGVRDLCRRGRLPAHREHGRWRVADHVIADYQQHRNRPA